MAIHSRLGWRVACGRRCARSWWLPVVYDGATGGVLIRGTYTVLRQQTHSSSPPATIPAGSHMEERAAPICQLPSAEYSPPATDSGENLFKESFGENLPVGGLGVGRGIVQPCLYLRSSGIISSGYHVTARGGRQGNLGLGRWDKPGFFAQLTSSVYTPEHPKCPARTGQRA